MIRFGVFSLLFLLCWQNSTGQPRQSFVTVKNLRSDWKVYQDDKFEEYSGGKVRAIHFTLDLTKTKGTYLRITNKESFHLFLNSVDQGRFDSLRWNCDSLARMGYSTALFSIYQEKSITALSTELVAYTSPGDLTFHPRPSQAFANFMLIAILLLVGFFTVLLQTQSQLAWDYLNVTKLFSFIGNDENPNLLRITSSANLLFYFFCGLLASLALIVVDHVTGEPLHTVVLFNSSTVLQFIRTWLLLSLLVVSLIFLKLVVSFLFSRLFNWSEINGFQFFNFIRTLLLTLVLVSVLGIAGFSIGISPNYRVLLMIGCLLLSAGPVIMFLKLLNRAPFNAFHLFFYLCATELFPLMTLFKLLLF